MNKIWSMLFFILCFFNSGFAIEKYYINSDKIFLNNTSIYIQCNDEYLITEKLRCDEYGFYIISKDVSNSIDLCGSKVSQRQKWQCPYCHQWWNIGEKCKNSKCPTNQW